MLETTLLWMTRIAIVLLLLATTVTLVPTGAWPVRLFDFPRLQLLMLLAIPLVGLAAHLLSSGNWSKEHSAILAAMLLIASWQLWHIVPFSPLWPHELADGKSPHDVRLMVANIQCDNREHESVEQVIKRAEPDLLLLVEINDTWMEKLQETREGYPYRVEEIRGNGLGLALWSKLPIESSEIKHLISKRRPSLFATIRMPDGQLANFAGVHPTPPGLLDSTEGGRRDSRIRDAELVVIARMVGDSRDTPWIVAGDFNDVAWSHSTRLFKRLSGLRDPRVGRGLHNTYHSSYPLLRYPIDQVFLPPNSTIRSLDRIELPGSDHFAVVSDFHVSTELPVAKATVADEAEALEIVNQGASDAEQRNVASSPADKR